MSRPTSFFLGYHGCERDLVDELIQGKKTLHPSKAKYHWLGKGAYFWEDDPLRALEWAIGRPAARALKNPTVVGAIIDPRNCLDLRVRENQELVRQAYDLLKAETASAGFEMPRNQEAPHDKSPDKVIRKLDYAVIDRLHAMIIENKWQQFDTVRSLFHEGSELYEGSGFWDKTHTEIAVLNDECIIGYFLPRMSLSIPMPLTSDGAT